MKNKNNTTLKSTSKTFLFFATMFSFITLFKEGEIWSILFVITIIISYFYDLFN